MISDIKHRMDFYKFVAKTHTALTQSLRIEISTWIQYFKLYIYYNITERQIYQLIAFLLVQMADYLKFD